MSPAASKLPDIRDIKPAVDLPDISFYIYWGLLAAVLAVFMGALVLLILRLRGMKRRNREKAYLEALHRVEWSDPKAAAYIVTRYGRLLATDDRRKELFSQLLPLLERYKYRIKVEKVDEETRRRFELYRKVCDESV